MNSRTSKIWVFEDEILRRSEVVRVGFLDRLWMSFSRAYEELPRRSMRPRMLPMTRLRTSASVSACSGGRADRRAWKAAEGRGRVKVGV